MSLEKEIRDWIARSHYDASGSIGLLSRAADELERLRGELARWNQMHAETYARNSSAMRLPR